MDNIDNFEYTPQPNDIIIRISESEGDVGFGIMLGTRVNCRVDAKYGRSHSEVYNELRNKLWEMSYEHRAIEAQNRKQAQRLRKYLAKRYAPGKYFWSKPGKPDQRIEDYANQFIAEAMPGLSAERVVDYVISRFEEDVKK